MEAVKCREERDLPVPEHVEAILAAEAERAAHLLRALEAELDDVDGGKDASTGGSPADPEDRMALASLVEACRADLAHLDAALVRLRAGSYGLCESCGARISPERLEAVPQCRFCMGCASASSASGASFRGRLAGRGLTARTAVASAPAVGAP